MATIPAKVLERFKENLSRLQKVLELAKTKDINEADTVVIVSDVLTNLFGYEKYGEVTHEYAVKGQYCDLAIKLDENLKFLIEVKAVGIGLQDKHLQQALNYGANSKTEWFIVTNAIIWNVYKVKFEKPIGTDFICSFNLLDIKLKNPNDVEKLYILCKEGLKKNAIDEFSEHGKIVNKYFVGAVLQSETVIDLIRKELRKLNASIKPESDEILSIVKNDVLKRDILDSSDAIASLELYTKMMKKLDKEKTKGLQTDKTQNEKGKNGDSSEDKSSSTSAESPNES